MCDTRRRQKATREDLALTEITANSQKLLHGQRVALADLIYGHNPEVAQNVHGQVVDLDAQLVRIHFLQTSTTPSSSLPHPPKFWPKLLAEKTFIVFRRPLLQCSVPKKFN